MKQLEFERTLTVGSAVRVAWTNCGNAYLVPGTVKKLNAKSVVVAITEEIRDYNGRLQYPVGNPIRVPLLSGMNTLWSVNNSVHPPA